jgi:hypothetical protein
MATHASPNTQRRPLSSPIDQASLNPSNDSAGALLVQLLYHGAERLREKIRRRTTALTRRFRPRGLGLITIRDQLILAVYAHTAPLGWFSAWCDGSCMKGKSGRYAGIGVAGPRRQARCATVPAVRSTDAAGDRGRRLGCRAGNGSVPRRWACSGTLGLPCTRTVVVAQAPGCPAASGPPAGLTAR